MSALRFTPLLLLLVACDEAPRPSAAEPGERLAGGGTTVMRNDRGAFNQPAANLSAERRLDFSAGRNFFRSPWVIAPASTTARDGLGPLFNANACQNCHGRNGRGHPPDTDATTAVSMVVRLSIGSEPEPTYGNQLQDMAVAGVTPEGKVRVAYSPVDVHFTDGSRVELRAPRLRLSRLGYGPMHPDTVFSARVAPPMIGLGLLEAISQADLQANVDQQQAFDDGVNGRLNEVQDDIRGTISAGRFGWKAGQPSLAQQNAHAFANDLGLTSANHPSDDCTVAQTACRQAPSGQDAADDHEVSANIERLVLFYTRNLAVPARRNSNVPQVQLGKQLFHQAGCQTCHVPSYTTRTDAAEPELANQRIYPYTDLLLHDMGEGLADSLGEYTATGRDWRTPPLWGVGLTEAVSGHTQFLHDGRARNLLEAVLWHGGEAQAAQRRVLTFNAEQRAALLAFLNSL